MQNSISLTIVMLISIVFSCCDDTPGTPGDDNLNVAGYYETFDFLDKKKWTVHLYTWDENGANMVADNVTIKKSILELSTTINQNAGFPKKYNGGGILDNNFNLYGYYEVRMKPMIKPGTVAAFFLMNQWEPEHWEHQEIDIEFTGNKQTSMQMTTHHYQDGGINHKYSATTKDLGFNISADFHNYGILWKPDCVSWYIDGKLFHTETLYVPKVPLQIILNHYPGEKSIDWMKNWLGELNDNELPSTVQYDWIKTMSVNDFKNKKNRQD